MAGHYQSQSRAMPLRSVWRVGNDDRQVASSYRHFAVVLVASSAGASSSPYSSALGDPVRIDGSIAALADAS